MSVVVSKVGHVVLRVADLQRSLPFYNGVLGLQEVARRPYGDEPWVFLSTGNTHDDVALVETVRADNAGTGSLTTSPSRSGTPSTCSPTRSPRSNTPASRYTRRSTSR
jgi:catechol 2,3-dioxygenase-like lactoylglutathione lyase family enzyme